MAEGGGIQARHGKGREGGAEWQCAQAGRRVVAGRKVVVCMVVAAWQAGRQVGGSGCVGKRQKKQAGR